MGDRMFASDDAVAVEHHVSAARADRWEPGAGLRRAQGEANDTEAGVVRRLQDRLDRHLLLLDRLRSDQLYPDPAGLPELLETGRRMRRDTECLLLLYGQDASLRADGPRPLSDVLGDGVAAAAEPRRVEIRSAPAATVAAAASVEFPHVLAELLDEVAATYPGARIDVAGRVEARGGIAVDVLVDGADRHRPDELDGRRAGATAELLARRSRCGVSLARSGGGPPPFGSGLVATVLCPASTVTLEEPTTLEEQVTLEERVPLEEQATLEEPVPLAEQTTLEERAPLEESAWPVFAAVGDRYRSGTNGNGSGRHGNGGGHSVGASVLDDMAAPAYVPSTSSQIDELFGPMFDLPLEPMDDRFATPIFEAIASAWFREDAPAAGTGRPVGADPLNWVSPHDGEWRAAAARAALPDPATTTSSGLPRRRPGSQLVPPPMAQGPAPGSGPAERLPDRVRDRLNTYQRGLRQGRHRKSGSESW